MCLECFTWLLVVSSGVLIGDVNPGIGRTSLPFGVVVFSLLYEYSKSVSDSLRLERMAWKRISC